MRFPDSSVKVGANVIEEARPDRAGTIPRVSRLKTDEGTLALRQGKQGYILGISPKKEKISSLFTTQTYIVL